jgi:hypothetical protein
MTAVNLIVAGEATYLLTDGAIIGEDGRLQSISTKVIVSHRLKCAIALTGGFDGETWHALNDFIEGCPSQHELMRLMPMSGLRAHALAKEALGRSSPRLMPTDTILRLIIGIWSETRSQAEGYIFGATAEDIPSGMRPGELNGCRRYIQPADVDLAVIPTGCLDREAALRLIEAQRHHRDAFGRHIVGGAAELVTVSQEGVTRAVLHRWHDRVGEPISLRQQNRRLSLGSLFRRSTPDPKGSC